MTFLADNNYYLHQENIMKTILSTIIALGLLGCLKPDDASLSFAEGDLKSSYVGTKKLRGALHQNRIYVISDLEFKSATFKLNGESLKRKK